MNRSERSPLCTRCRRAFGLHYQSSGDPEETNALGPTALGRLSFLGGCKCAATGWMRARRRWRPGRGRESPRRRVKSGRAETGRKRLFALRAGVWVHNPWSKKRGRSGLSSNTVVPRSVPVSRASRRQRSSPRPARRHHWHQLRQPSVVRRQEGVRVAAAVQQGRPAAVRKRASADWTDLRCSGPCGRSERAARRRRGRSCCGCRRWRAAFAGWRPGFRGRAQ